MTLEQPAAERTRRRTLAWLAALLSLAVSAASLARNPPLGSLGGVADEWLYLGMNLAINGTIGLDHQPGVFRPPGYVAFEAVVLRLMLRLPAQHDMRLELPAARAIYASHCVLLAAASSLLFLWLSRRLRPGVAFAAAVWFGTSPYSVVLTTFRHYDVAHWLVLIALGWALEAWTSRERGPLFAVGVGALCAVATLVRPVTLLIPPFVGLLILWRGRSLPRALRETAWFTGAFLLCLAPWTARNYVVSGRIIPVNAQTWTVAWATTVARVPADPDRYRWYAIVMDRYLPIYERVTGRPDYDYRTFAPNIVRLEDTFRVEAIANLRRDPSIYVGNVADAFVSIHTGINAVMLTIFRQLRAGQQFQPAWIAMGAPGSLPRGIEGQAFAALFAVVGLLALYGLVLGLREGDGFVLVPALLHLSIATAHSLVYMDTLYYYFKVPLVLALAFYGANRLGRWAAPVAYALTGASAVLTAWTLFG